MTTKRNSVHPVVVRYFGPLLDVTGTAEETLEIALPARVSDIERQIQRSRPGLERHLYRIAVDEAFRDGGDSIEQASEIALLPAFSGG